MRANHISKLVVLLVLCGFQAAQTQENKPPISLQGLVDEALEHNPEIKAAESRWRAFQQKPAQMSALPDPMFSYTRFGSSVETRVGPQENVLSLSQRIPFPGKLGLKGRMAGQDVRAEELRYHSTRRDITHRLKLLYFDLYWVDRSTMVLDQYLSLLRDFTQVAEQKYATGQGIQANVLKSQVEISSILEKKLGFDKIRHGLVARINAIIDRPPASAIGTVVQIDTARSVVAEDIMIEKALAERQELRVVQAMLMKSELSKQLAGKEYLPDFNFQANYIDVSKGVSNAPDAGRNAWSLMVGINLPIWLGKRKAAVREAEQMISAQNLSETNLENQIKAEVRDLCLQLEISTRTLDLYEQGLIAQAENSLQSAMASYSTGRLDFLNLLDAERMLLSLNLGYVKEQAGYQKQLATLERIVGGELPN